MSEKRQQKGGVSSVSIIHCFLQRGPRHPLTFASRQASGILAQASCDRTSRLALDIRSDRKDCVSVKSFVQPSTFPKLLVQKASCHRGSPMQVEQCLSCASCARSTGGHLQTKSCWTSTSSVLLIKRIFVRNKRSLLFDHHVHLAALQRL